MGDTFDNLPPGKQLRILDAAVDEFADHGFESASINRLVARLGIAKGSIFSYFGSKAGLFETVLARVVGLFADSLRRVRDETAHLDAMARIRASLAAGERFIRDNPRIYRIYLKLLFQDGFPLRERFLSMARVYSAKYLRPIVVAGIERGELRSNLDPDWAVFYLDALMDRFLQSLAVQSMDAGLGLYRADPQTARAGIDKLMELIEHGLGPANRTGAGHGH